MSEKTVITVETLVDAPAQKAWDGFTKPESIVKWNFADPSWHCPSAGNDVRVGGTLKARMEAKDGSMGFDFEARYTEVTPLKRLKYVMGEDEGKREVVVEFRAEGSKTRVVESFEAESTFSHEQQRSGWQSILDNYKKHVEGR
jgi:uncharacterized protein YndB with AHSA1/START domain